jgi:hypothetical protein
MLVPEVVNVDDVSLERLLAATPEVVQLSDSSPLGVKFWNLTTSASEEARRGRVAAGRPGSPCPKGHLALDMEMAGIPMCPASRVYQKRALAALGANGSTPAGVEKAADGIRAKSCICHDLGGGVLLRYGIDRLATTAVCPGPNIVNFKRVASLDEMVGHVYGRTNLIATTARPHAFVTELRLYVEHLRRELPEPGIEPPRLKLQQLVRLRENLLRGIEHYRSLTPEHVAEHRRFVEDLAHLEVELREIRLPGEGETDGRPDGAPERQPELENQTI